MIDATNMTPEQMVQMSREQFGHNGSMCGNRICFFAPAEKLQQFINVDGYQFLRGEHAIICAIDYEYNFVVRSI